MKKHILDGIEVQIEKKAVKHFRLSVKPPCGEVYVSAPKQLSDKQILEILEVKLPWMKEKQEKFRKQPRKIEKKYISGERFPLWGKEYPLQVLPVSGRRNVLFQNGEIQMRIRDGSTQQQRESLLKAWYREELQRAIPAISQKYEEKMGVHAKEWKIKEMKTRWGTCNIAVKRIWLNLTLAWKPPECLEYVIVHELCHLLEKSHNSVFKSYMNVYFPDWKEVKKELNKISYE